MAALKLADDEARGGLSLHVQTLTISVGRHEDVVGRAKVDHVGESGIECYDAAAVHELRITDVPRMPMPLFASPWIATPLDVLMYSAQTTVVAHVVDVARAAPESATIEIASTAENDKMLRTIKPLP